MLSHSSFTTSSQVYWGESNSTSVHDIKASKYEISQERREQVICFDSITSFTMLKALHFILAIITTSQALLHIKITYFREVRLLARDQNFSISQEPTCQNYLVCGDQAIPHCHYSWETEAKFIADN